MGKATPIINDFDELIRDHKIPEEIEDDDRLSDDLTGLANTRSFREEAPEKLRAIIDEVNDPVYVFFDIDNFKSYNEIYGFSNGDKVLRGIADTLRTVFPDALIARLSADHFVVLTDNENIESHIKNAQANIFGLGRSGIIIKAGVYVAKDTKMDVSSAYDRARIAMISIKGKRDKNYCFYDESMGERLHLQNYIVDHVIEAVDNDDIVPVYQPIVDVKDGSIAGCEALARWKDPNRGLIMPDQFIDTLEDFRLIHNLDGHVLDDVLKMLADRLKMGASIVPVSINLSQLDFEEVDVVKIAGKKLQEYGVPAELIRIELTESIMTRYPEYLKQEISRLHEIGFKVWMDDFGSGYSSLNALQDYDFDLIKLDMRFLENLETNPKTGVIIRSVVSMAKELGMETLAEGAETKEQVDYLKGAGCDYVQGFYLGKPEQRYVLDLERGW